MAETPVAEEGRRRGLSDGGAYVILTVAMAAWSGNIVVARAVVDVVPPFIFSLGRWSIAFLAVLPFVAPELYAKRAIIFRQWPLLLFLGVLSVTLANGLTYVGATMSTAINGAMVTSAGPMATVAVAYLCFRERATWGQIQGIALSSAGVLTILTHGNLENIAQLSFNWGDLLYFFGIIAWALYSLLLRRVSPSLSPLVVVTLMFGVGILTFLPLHLVFEQKSLGDIPLTLPVMAAFLYVGLFPSVLSFISWNAAVKVIGTHRAIPFNHLNPLITTVLAFFFLHEEIAAYHLLGAALIFAGIFLAGRKARVRHPYD